MNQFKEGDLVRIKKLSSIPELIPIKIVPGMHLLSGKTGIIRHCIRGVYDPFSFSDASYDGCAYLVNDHYFSNVALEKVEESSNEVLTINFK